LLHWSPPHTYRSQGEAEAIVEDDQRHLAEGIMENNDQPRPAEVIMEDDDDDHDLDDFRFVIAAALRREPLEVIQSFIASNPEMLRRRNDAGLLPIHRAIQHGLPPPVLRLLLREWPGSALEGTDDANRSLPAHLVCMFANNRLVDADMPAAELLASVKAVVRANPAALGTRDADGRLPLHAAVRLHILPVQVIEYLARKHPEGLRARDADGMLPLHLALLNCREVAALPGLKHLVESWPQSARERTRWGDIPLYLAVEMGAPVGVVEVLDKAWPGAIRSRSRTGIIPLHAAARMNNVPLAKFLVARWPDSVRLSSNSGELALHTAAAEGSVSVMRFLVSRWQNSVRSRSGDGRLPIHEAAKRGKRDAVRYLVSLWPGSVLEIDHNGGLPIHAAGRCRPFNRRGVELALDATRFLVGQHPPSVWATDDVGCLPIHLAAGDASLLRCVGDRSSSANDDYEDWRRAAAETELCLVRFLSREAPMTLRKMSRDGKLPVHFAIEGGLALSTVEHLWERWPEDEGSPASDQFSTGIGLTALHLAASREVPSVEHVEFLLRLRPQLLLEVDPDGRLPVHYAAACKHLCLDVCRLLVERSPDSLRHAASDGSLPLHACVNRWVPSLEKIQYFVGQYPKALAVKDSDGSLPLHVALARRKVPREVVQFLVEQEPRSLRQKDGWGRLPLHVAAVRDAELDLLYYLVSKDPESVCSGGRLSERPRPFPRSRKRKADP
jgi:26S proteasome non-ATPase regulatory subunit 10